jgi:site-specific recombinase XerD
LSENGGEERGGQSSGNGPRGLSIRELSFAWTLAARAEAKSENTVRMMHDSLGYFVNYLGSIGIPDEAESVSPVLLRSYMVYLQQKPAFSSHPFSRPQPRLLSDQSVNGYLRALRAFFNWLTSEGFLQDSPFARLKLPRMKQRIIKPYGPGDLKGLLGAVDTGSPEGYRDLCLLLVMFDTAARSSEVTGIKLQDVDLDEGCVKLLGKGNKERMVPIGSEVKRRLWRYVKMYRPQPANPLEDFLFLTFDGRRLTKNRLYAIVRKYSARAGIQGVRCSPHTIRHTAALAFLQNKGDAFALQKLLGHTSLEMTRRYCLLSDSDLKKMHHTASPVDNLHFRGGETHTRRA